MTDAVQEQVELARMTALEYLQKKIGTNNSKKESDYERHSLERMRKLKIAGLIGENKKGRF